MLNIVIPMAGRGSRFLSAGYTLPKPLIPVKGIPMVRLVIENLCPVQEHRFFFICLEEHLQKYHIGEKLEAWAPNCKIITTDGVTEGAACTVLLAKNFINNDEPLMIANSDQWVDIDINRYLEIIELGNADGLIMTMWADDPKWSYLRFDEAGGISAVVEKQVVSNEATVGIYNYRRGADFVRAAERMIAKNLRVNNEFYVAPAYNEMIADGMEIIYHNVGRVADGMYGLGTPSDLKNFEKLPVSEKATRSFTEKILCNSNIAG
jgi:NDP-sugar pyrophosphorylase family protein